MFEERTLASSTIPAPILSNESGNDSASSLTISEYEHDSSLSEMDEEDEVFFGPMSRTELRRLHEGKGIHRRSTEMLTLMPLCEDNEDDGSERSGNSNTPKPQTDTEKQQQQQQQQQEQTPKEAPGLQMPIQCATPELSPMGGIVQQAKDDETAAALLIQSHFRRALAKDACKRRRNDLRFLAMKGSLSVERRRRPTATSLQKASNEETEHTKPKVPKVPTMVPKVPMARSRLHPKVPLPALPIAKGADSGASNGWNEMSPAPLLSASVMYEKKQQQQQPQSAGIVASSPLRRGLSIRNWFHRQHAQQETISQATGIPLPSRPSTAINIPTKVTTTSEKAGWNTSKARAYLARMVSHWRHNHLTKQTSEPEQHAQELQVIHQRFRSRRQYNRRQQSLAVNHPPLDHHLSHIATNPPPSYSELCASHILLVPLDDCTAPCQQQMPNNNNSSSSNNKQLTVNLMRVDSNDTASDSSTLPAAPTRFPKDGPSASAVGTKLTMFKSSLGSLLTRSSSTLRFNDPAAAANTTSNSRKPPTGVPLVSPGVFGDTDAPMYTAPINPIAAAMNEDEEVMFVDMIAEPSSAIASHHPSNIPRPPHVSNTPYSRSMIPRVTRLASAPSVGRVNGVPGKRVPLPIPPPIPPRSSSRKGDSSSTDTDEDSGIAAAVSKLTNGTATHAVNEADAEDDSEDDAQSGVLVTGAMAVPTEFAKTKNSHTPPDTPQDQYSVATTTTSGSSSDVSMIEAPSEVEEDHLVNGHNDESDPELVSVANAKDLDNVFGAPSAKEADSPEPHAPPTLGINSMANISPRLSLRLSSDASTFSFGLSALASLINNDDAGEFKSEEEEGDSAAYPSEGDRLAESGKVDRPPPFDENGREGGGGDSHMEEEGSRDEESNDSQLPEKEMHADESHNALPASSLVKEEPSGTNAADARVEEDMENPVHARLRSLRSRRLQDSNKAQSTAAAEAAAAAPPPPSTTGSSSKGKNTTNATKTKPLSKMGPLQLDRLTKLNTRRNSTYLTCKIEFFVVQKDGDRPPSPSLLMQEKAQLRRALKYPSTDGATEEDGASGYHSIYSASSDNDDEEEDEEEEEESLVDDTCPLSPYASSDEIDVRSTEDTAEPLQSASASDVKRKSVELEAGLKMQEPRPSCSNKKQCVRPRVRWGSRSVLQNTWLMSHSRKSSAQQSSQQMSDRGDVLGKSILVHCPTTTPTGSEKAEEDEVDEKKRGFLATVRASRRTGKPSGLNIIRVACIEYPDSLQDIEDFYSDDGEKSIESDSSDEYMHPRPPKNSAKKSNKKNTKKTKERAPPTMASKPDPDDDSDMFIPRRSARKKLN